MVVEGWTPDLKVELATGVPAKKWAQRMTTLSLAGPLLIAVLISGMAITGGGYVESPFLVTVMGLLIADAAGALIALWQMLRAERRERLMGYTSTRAHIDLPEVDVLTGHVVRIAGEGPLSREERMRRIGAIRGRIDH